MSTPTAKGSRVHLIPADRVDMRMIDSERVCEAISALGEPGTVADWAQRYAIVSDPTRLALLLCIYHAGPISVSDLAVALGANDATVSQALRHLRSSATVSAARDGRVIRYTLADRTLVPLLDSIGRRAAGHGERD
jgi:ArsR family transcriptional regulator, lead/cadmium/zinc/bismuth-responsive transcriptional repressor